MTARSESGLVHPSAIVRAELARELSGEGIEFGPGCHPLALGPLVRHVHYVDRFDRDGFLKAFPEASAEIAGFPSPVHQLLDFEKEDFPVILGEAKWDFVVASHVLEHLVDPIEFLRRCHRLLTGDGTLFLVIPDKRAIFDRDRNRTRLAELIERHARGQVELTEEMIVDFVNNVERPAQPFGPATPDYHERIEKIRQRSIHANVWVVDDLLEILQYLAEAHQAPFALTGGLVTTTEAILLLRRADDAAVVNRYAAVMSRIWHESARHYWEVNQAPRLDQVERLLLDTCDRLARLDERARETQNFIRRLKGAIDRLPWVGPLSRRMSRVRRD